MEDWTATSQEDSFASVDVFNTFEDIFNNETSSIEEENNDNEVVDDRMFADTHVDVSEVFDDVIQNYSLVHAPVSRRHYNHKQRISNSNASSKALRLCSTIHINKKCCKQQCLHNFSLEELNRIRLPFIAKSERQKSEWLLNVLKATSIWQPGSSPLIVYRLEGRQICRTAYIRVLGISNSKLNPILNNIKENHVVPNPHRNSLRDYESPQRDKVHLFLLSLVNIFFDEQPDSDEWHCPIVLSKKLLYDSMCEQFVQSPPSKPTFYTILAQYRWIKFPKNTRLGKCDECIELKIELQEVQKQTQVAVDAVKKKIKDHNALQRSERQTYDSRKAYDSSILWQNIWDGYSGVLIPHLAWPHFPKSWLRLPRLRLQVSGLINHNLGVRQLYFSIAQHFDHDSNYSINILATHISQQLLQGKLPPPKLVFQSDNCWRENKNIFVLGFFAVLLLKGLTKDIYFICLLQGHTHTDIDQENVPFATGLNNHDLKTAKLEEIIDYVQKCYSSPPEVHMMQSIWNFKEWLAPYLPKLIGHTKPHVFWLSTNESGHVVMRWRDYTSTDEEWKGDKDGLPITILTQMPPGKPSIVVPHPIDDKVKVATRQTYDKLSEEDINFYTELFATEPTQTDETALHFLSYVAANDTMTNTPLTFLPKQKQIKWNSTTSISVQTKAAVGGRVNEMGSSEQGDESGPEDYDAPILMQAVDDRTWTAKEYRGLSTANYGRSQRPRAIQNYASLFNNNIFDD